MLFRSTKSSIYEEFFTFKEIIPQTCTDEKNLLKIKVKYLRNCDNKIFSFQVIADILGTSKTNVSKIMTKEN